MPDPKPAQLINKLILSDDDQVSLGDYLLEEEISIPKAYNNAFSRKQIELAKVEPRDTSSDTVSRYKHLEQFWTDFVRDNRFLFNIVKNKPLKENLEKLIRYAAGNQFNPEPGQDDQKSKQFRLNVIAFIALVSQISVTKKVDGILNDIAKHIQEKFDSGVAESEELFNNFLAELLEIMGDNYQFKIDNMYIDSLVYYRQFLKDLIYLPVPETDGPGEALLSTYSELYHEAVKKNLYITMRPVENGARMVFDRNGLSGIRFESDTTLVITSPGEEAKVIDKKLISYYITSDWDNEEKCFKPHIKLTGLAKKVVQDPERLIQYYNAKALDSVAKFEDYIKKNDFPLYQNFLIESAIQAATNQLFLTLTPEKRTKIRNELIEQLEKNKLSIAANVDEIQKYKNKLTHQAKQIVAPHIDAYMLTVKGSEREAYRAAFYIYQDSPTKAYELYFQGHLATMSNLETYINSLDESDENIKGRLEIFKNYRKAWRSYANSRPEGEDLDNTTINLYYDLYKLQVSSVIQSNIQDRYDFSDLLPNNLPIEKIESITELSADKIDDPCIELAVAARRQEFLQDLKRSTYLKINHKDLSSELQSKLQDYFQTIVKAYLDLPMGERTVLTDENFYNNLLTFLAYILKTVKENPADLKEKLEQLFTEQANSTPQVKYLCFNDFISKLQPVDTPESISKFLQLYGQHLRSPEASVNKKDSFKTFLKVQEFIQALREKFIGVGPIATVGVATNINLNEKSCVIKLGQDPGIFTNYCLNIQYVGDNEPVRKEIPSTLINIEVINGFNGQKDRTIINGAARKLVEDPVLFQKLANENRGAFSDLASYREAIKAYPDLIADYEAYQNERLMISKLNLIKEYLQKQAANGREAGKSLTQYRLNTIDTVLLNAEISKDYSSVSLLINTLLHQIKAVSLTHTCTFATALDLIVLQAEDVGISAGNIARINIEVEKAKAAFSKKLETQVRPEANLISEASEIAQKQYKTFQHNCKRILQKEDNLRRNEEIKALKDGSSNFIKLLLPNISKHIFNGLFKTGLALVTGLTTAIFNLNNSDETFSQRIKIALVTTMAPSDKVLKGLQNQAKLEKTLQYNASVVSKHSIWKTKVEKSEAKVQYKTPVPK